MAWVSRQYVVAGISGDHVDDLEIRIFAQHARVLGVLVIEADGEMTTVGTHGLVLAPRE
jgi:hypothetical protein